MSSALEKLRQRARQPGAAGVEISTRRGVVATMSAHVDEDVDEDIDENQGHDDVQMPRPGKLMSLMSAPGVALDAKVDAKVDAKGASKGNANGSTLNVDPESALSAIEKLRVRARKEQQAADELSGFKKNMAALRTLGRLMEAVYIRPGNASPVQDRMNALLTLTQTSQQLSQDLLAAIGETSNNAYVRAMAMDAVVSLIGKSWEDASDEDDFLRARPIELLREAAINPQVVQASLEMAQKTWDPVTTAAQHDEVLAMSAHKAYWSLYMLGEHVVGMDASKCEAAVSRLMSHLQDYPRPRGSNPEMRASWIQASMGRLSRLAGAEIKARFAVSEQNLHNAKPVTLDMINECVDLAIEGFENVERHAQKILGGSYAERVSADRPHGADSSTDGDRSAAGH